MAPKKEEKKGIYVLIKKLLELLTLFHFGNTNSLIHKM